MTPEERELVKSEIEIAVLKGFASFSDTVDTKITSGIDGHQRLCDAQRKGGDSEEVPIGWLAKNWKAIGVGVLIIAGFMSHFTGSNQKFTPEELNQLKQLTQQIQKVTK